MSGSLMPDNGFKKAPKDSNSADEKPTHRNASFYDFYVAQMYPAIMSSLPLLITKLAEDAKDLAANGTRKLIDFVLPKWSSENPDSLPTMKQLLDVASAHSPSEFMLRNFDINGDGHISSAELLNMTEIMTEIMKRMPSTPETWATWFRREWPLMDWKIGVFLWRSFGGVLVLLAFLSVVPGRLHGISGKILRWPVLGMTYFLITVELV
jgi:hypothetical protein